MGNQRLCILRRRSGEWVTAAAKRIAHIRCVCPNHHDTRTAGFARKELRASDAFACAAGAMAERDMRIGFARCNQRRSKRFMDKEENPMLLDVVAIGELLVDLTGIATDRDGYPTFAAHPGGAPCNFLAALSRFGARSAFIGKVGDDAFGRLLKNTLADAGIETRGLIMDPDVFTTLAFVSLDAHGERVFSFARKPGADTRLRPEELDLSLIDAARILHFGSLSLTGEPARSATRRAVAFAKERGKWVTFDPNLRVQLWPSEQAAREQILWGLGRADVVKISGEEVAFLWTCSAEEGAKRLVHAFGVRLAMVTLGAEGCLLMTAKASCRIKPPAVSPVDTTGAGDIFGGSAVFHLLELGRAPEELIADELAQIGRFAAAAASLSTERSGGMQSVPSLETVRANMSRSQIVSQCCI